MKFTGEKIRSSRKSCRFSQEKLGASVGAGKRYICEIENGQVEQASAEKLLRIADELGVSIGYLLDDDAVEQTDEHKDDAFYRAYLRLSKPRKEQMRAIAGTYIN